MRAPVQIYSDAVTTAQPTTRRIVSTRALASAWAGGFLVGCLALVWDFALEFDASWLIPAGLLSISAALLGPLSLPAFVLFALLAFSWGPDAELLLTDLGGCGAATLIYGASVWCSREMFRLRMQEPPAALARLVALAVIAYVSAVLLNGFILIQFFAAVAIRG